MRALDHLTIFVSNLARSREWYVARFGLRVEFEVEQPPAVALIDDGGFTLFLEQRPAGECRPGCVLTFRVEDVDRVTLALKQREVLFENDPRKLFWGYGAELRDPDGYLIRLWDEKSMREKG